MNHQQLLDHLSARHLVRSITADVARLTITAMMAAKHQQQGWEEVQKQVLQPLLQRWNCVLQADDQACTPLYRHTTYVALATVLHKHGFAETALTQQALESIDALNKAVALSDHFFHKTPQAKALLQGAPVPLTKKPALPDSLTFYRAGDVLAMELDKKFYGVYVHSIASICEAPIVEFYEGLFKHRPSLADLQNRRAQGRIYNDGNAYIEKYAIYGLTYLQDPANQLHLVGSGVQTPPDNQHLQTPGGLYTVFDLFRLQANMQTIFAN